MKKINLVIIGSEILQGKTQDKNIYNLAQLIHLKPFQINEVFIISDELDFIQKTLKLAWKDADIVITSGGMGPTPDDLTKNALAAWSKKKIEVDLEALKFVNSHYERFQREYDNVKFSYHRIPQGFQALFNPTGLAPGLAYYAQNKWLFALPGVPSEFKSMFTQSVLPLIIKNSEVVEDFFIAKTWQLPESEIFNKLCPNLWDELSEFGAVSSLPHPLGVDIGVTLRGALRDVEEQKKILEQKFLNSVLRDHLWHLGNSSLEELILSYAIKSKKTFGFVESCSGGLCSSKMTDVPGVSAFFKGSLVTYQNSCKEKILGIDADFLQTHGAVSSQVAELMAQNGRKILAADIVISLTGFAGPSGGEKNPIGRVFCGVASQGRNEVVPFLFKGDRAALKERFAQAGLHLLRESLAKLLV